MARRIWLYSAGLILLAAAATGGYLFWPAPSAPPEIASELLSRSEAIIDIEAAGVYGITVEQLQSAGLSLTSWEESSPQLTSLGETVPFTIQGEKLVFYGQGAQSIYTRSRPYLLSFGSPSDRPAPNFPLLPPPSSAGATTPFVYHTASFEENNVYVSAAYDEEHPDTWFWHTIHVQQKFEIPFSIEGVYDGSAQLTLYLYGQSHDPKLELDHDLDLELNGRPLGTIQWDGQVHHVATVDIPAGTLQNGENRLLLDNSPPGAAFVDIMQLNRFDLRFPALPQALADQITFASGSEEMAVTLTGFSGEPLILDITDPGQVATLPVERYEAGTANLQLPAGRQLVAVGPEGIAPPPAVRPRRTSSLVGRENRADLIIITTDDLAPAVAPLVAAREAQGLAVVVATTAEIYDQFGDGDATPYSIRRFLQHAAAEWASPAPAYVLLVGAGRYDFRNFTGTLPDNQVPSLMIPAAHSGETVSDPRLGDVDLDGRPDLAVGRWPVETREQVGELIERTLAYEAGQVAGQALFTADGTSSEFTSFSDQLAETTNLGVDDFVKLYGAPFEEVATRWNEGSWLVSYVGHGSISLWGKDGVFNSEAVTSLRTNPDYAPPIVTQFTCLTGFFAHPTERSLSEQMLLDPDGPVLVVGATSLTYSAHQRPFAERLLVALQDPAVERIGDAMRYAKADLDLATPGVREVVDTFGLLGDPSALIIRPTSN